MNGQQTIVVFLVDGQRCAFPLQAVERAVRAVEVTPLPNMPDVVLGAIDVQGQVLPVISLRRWLGRPQGAIKPEEHLLIVRVSTGCMALLVDEVRGVRDLRPEQVVTSHDMAGGVPASCMLLHLDDGIMLLPDLGQIAIASEAALGPNESLARTISIEEAER